MLRKLKLIWQILFGNPVKVAQKQSDAIFNVFTQTQNKVQKVNSTIATHAEKKVSQVDKLQTEVGILNATAARNERLANKIGEFLKD